MLAERGIIVTREFVGLWCNKFGPHDAKRLRRKHQGFGDSFFIDEVFVKIDGKQHYLLWAVDQDGDVIDVFLQLCRGGAVAKRFFECLMKSNRGEPRRIVTNKLRSYGVAHRELIPDVIHDNSQYANNQAELSHQPAPARERDMRLLRLIAQAQRFFSIHGTMYNLFNLGRYLVSATHYRLLRQSAFLSWQDVATV